MENNYCNKCGECCRNIRADFKRNILYFDGIQELDPKFKDMLIEKSKDGDISECTCRYLKGNLCTNPQKHIFCALYPSHPFANLPEDCDFRGIIFMQSEKIKKTIRKMKEEIIHYSSLIESGVSKTEQNQYQKIINSHQSYINRYLMYGSNDW